MDASEAREHLELVERIIAASSQKLEAGGEFFVIWGIAGAAIDALFYFAPMWRLSDESTFGAYAVLLAIAIALSAWRGMLYRRHGSGISLLQREYFHVLWLALAVAIVADAVGFNIFSGWAASGVWNLAEAVVLLYIGIHGNRRAQIGGLVLILSLAIANFVPTYTGLILGAGVLLGYAGFGVADLLARD